MRAMILLSFATLAACEAPRDGTEEAPTMTEEQALADAEAMITENTARLEQESAEPAVDRASGENE